MSLFLSVKSWHACTLTPKHNLLCSIGLTHEDVSLSFQPTFAFHPILYFFLAMGTRGRSLGNAL